MLFERFESLEGRRDSLARVTREEVREVARTIARPDRLNVIAVGLLEDGEDERLTDVVKGWRGAG
jgi:hypothetical protein